MTSFPISPPANAAAVHDDCSTTDFSTLHPDIIESYILTRLDGPTLASVSSSSTSLYRLSSQDHLWSQVCLDRWPSTVTPRVTEIISAFPNGGARAFFAQSCMLPLLDSSVTASSATASFPEELLSAVDIHYNNELIFSKIQETETSTGWFRCSPFRIDLLEPKDAIPTPIKHPERDDTWLSLIGDMTLSWILIDPIGRRSVNLSSHNPVSVQRHWLSGEVYARYSWILTAEDQKGHVQCGIVVTCGRSERGEIHVKEVSMEMEDIDGKRLNGKDTMVILERALEGKKGIARNKEVEGQKRYKKFLEKREERKVKKLRRENAIDMLWAGYGIAIFSGLFYLLWRFSG